MEDNELRAFFAEVQQRFSEVQQRFTEVQQRFTEVDQRFSQLDDRVRKIGIDVDGLRADMQRNDELIHLVDQKVDHFRVETRNNFKSVHETIGASNAQLIHRLRKIEEVS